MSDRYSRLLAEYTASVRWERLSPEVVHEVKRRVLDSLGVALAAFAEDAPKAARAYAYELSTPNGATLWGTPVKASPGTAAFANAVMVRYLDFNDTYLSREPLHPSDMIPALFALAEWRRCHPRDLIAAIALAYEVGVCLCDAASLRAHGWDHVNYTALGTACGAAYLLGLTPPQTEHALAITAVPHAAMRQTRAGELSMWKGAAAAEATRNALEAALLAACGMTGPSRPFEGEMGIFAQLLRGERFDEAALRPLAEQAPPSRIRDTYIKFWPVEYHAQSAVDAALRLRQRIQDPARIASVHIETFRAAYEIIAKDPEKWEPKTRETADHSLPYIVAVTLLDGEVNRSSFIPARFRDPDLRAFLKDRVTLQEDPALTRGYPEGIPNRITVRTQDGATYEEEVRFPRGHARNPMTDEEVMEKFRRNVAEVWTPAQAERVAEWVWRLEAQEDLEELVRLLYV
ncbi:MAG: MmgE/PrpD family protein [Armatimonadota bacterium]|nr:MmgE/PrpD family protein [Armatimonadota bacterium]MDR7444128.1 MmgE/PrpD family protein [Armatimonadota bacterium]MDR7569545.1 MmgE/PrpD family protein [Armatimonadota bacterium]MDR7613577.1 MmgE/PrpD family protein [Armatimonadota bacterium]